MSQKKMDYHEFEDFVREAFQQKYMQSAEVEIRSIWKNNGIQRKGLSIIPKGKKVTPTIYLEEFYEEYLRGISLEGIISGIESVYLREKVSEDIEIEYFNQYNSVKDTLRVKLINYERNKQLLDQIPYLKILDLALICYSVIETPTIQNGAITVYRSYMDMWKITEEELFTEALRNSQQHERELLIEMSEVIREFQKDLADDILLPAEQEKEERMYVLTNQPKMNGAAVLWYPGVLQMCAAKLKTEFYILPSSIHEVILVPAEGNQKQELLSMVREVNDEQVAEEEILSYHVYKYDKTDNTLEDLVTKEVVQVP